MLPGELVVTLQADGSVKIDARKLQGTTPEIMRELEALAAEVGGELVVEKHVGGAHVHSHGDGKVHSHGH
jgi:hypothetical protein